jgi:hypothetical protein
MFAALPLAAGQSGQDDPGAGEPGKPGSSRVIRGGSGSPGPSGAPGQVITPTPVPTEAPAEGGSGGTTTTPAPTPAPKRTAKPASDGTRIEVERQSNRSSPALPALAGIGLLAGAALLFWVWRRGVPGSP